MEYEAFDIAKFYTFSPTYLCASAPKVSDEQPARGIFCVQTF